MNTIEHCVTQCPILAGIEDLETRRQLVEKYRQHCYEQRLGQIGLLCGQPTGDEKNAMSRASDAARQLEARLEATRQQREAELKV